MAMISLLARLKRDRRGATAVEYVMMAAILGIVAIVGAQKLTSEVGRLQTEVAGTITAAKPAAAGD